MECGEAVGNQFDCWLLNPLYLARQKGFTQRRRGRRVGKVMTTALNEITGAIIETAIEIHRQLGPGLLESVYRKILAHELRKKGFDVREEWPIPVVWDNMRMELGFRADLLVNSAVFVELKSVERIAPVAKKILLTYLRLADLRLGLLINFGEELLKNGISRVANNYDEELSGRGAEVAEKTVS
jgi:GxxExxY protein